MKASDISGSKAPPSVLLTHDGPVSTITLNRPHAYNAIDAEVTQLLSAAMDEIEASSVARVVVLRGAGKGFCAGGDLPFFAAQGDGLHRTVDRMLDDGGRFLQALHHTDKPVIASVHGTAAGAGLSLVVACDFCIAASDAVFVPAYAMLAVSPDLGGTANMVRAIGYRQAMRVFFLEDRLTAAEAERVGIVSRVVAPAALPDATLALALRLSGMSRASAESTKALLRQASRTGLAEQLAAESRSFQACIHGPQTQAALRRFSHRRANGDSQSNTTEAPP